MKDDTATLTSVGVRTNSVITLNGEKVDVKSPMLLILTRPCKVLKLSIL